MKITFKKQKGGFGIAAIIAALMALVASAVVGYFGGTQIYESLTTESATTTAIITDIDYYYDSDGDRNYRVYVDYTVDEENYIHVQLGHWTAGMHVGQEVTVKYDVNNPGNLLADTTDIIFFALGFAVCVIVFVVFFNIGLKESKNNKLNKKVLVDPTSRKRTAILVSTGTDMHTRVNYTYPYSYADFAFLGESGDLRVAHIGGIKTSSIRSEYDGYSDSGKIGTSLKPGMLADVYTNSYCSNGVIDPNSIRESNIELENGNLDKAKELLENGEVQY